MNRSDFIASPGGCVECVHAGVSELERRRDPKTGELLHGMKLAAWYRARAEFLAKARAAVGSPRGQRTGRMTKLVQG